MPGIACVEDMRNFMKVIHCKAINMTQLTIFGRTHLMPNIRNRKYRVYTRKLLAFWDWMNKFIFLQPSGIRTSGI
jgi:hypothetical protein